VEAFSTGDTIFFSNSLHMGDEAMLCHFKDISPRNIDTGLNATETHHTSIKPLSDQGGPIRCGGNFSFLWRILVLFDPEFIGAILKLTFATSITYWAIQGMINQ
jgi:hypothetical protein